MATNSNLSVAMGGIEEIELEDFTQTALTNGRFPGVVCFYRSANQRKQEYGVNEALASPPLFGFDTYIPKLYGVDSKVRNSYIQNSIPIGYDVKDDDGESAKADLYPLEAELVHDTPSSRGMVSRYFVPWLYPTQASMELFVKIIYPKDMIGSEDDFRKYKTDKSEIVERIHFKLVKVDDSWAPVELQSFNETTKLRTPKKNQYEGVAASEKLSKEEIKHIDAEIKEKEEDIKEKDKNIGKKRKELSETEAELSRITTPYNKQLDAEYAALNKKMRKINAKGRSVNKMPAGEKRNEEYSKYSKDKEKYETEKAALDEKNKKWGETFENPNAATNERIEELNALKLELETNLPTLTEEANKARKELSDLKEKKRANCINPPDDTLSVSGNAFLDFSFESEDDASAEASVTILRKAAQKNKKAALIAYYIRKDDKDVDKEYIIGQVNILPYSYCEILGNHDSETPIYLNPVPIHYIEVLLKRYTEATSAEGLPFHKAEIEADPVSLIAAGSLPPITATINDYFKQTGLSFEENRAQHSTLIVKHLTKADGKVYLVVNNVEFELENLDGKMYVKCKNKDGERALDTYLMEEFKQVLTNKILLKRSAKSDADNIHADDIDARYLTFLRSYSDLCPMSTDVENAYPAEALQELTSDIVHYLVYQCHLVFVLPQVEGGDGKTTVTNSGTTTTTLTHGTQAYVGMDDKSNGNNYVVLFNSGYNTPAETIAHEFGHCLDLQHTFNDNYRMYADSVDFESAPNWAHQVADKNRTDAGGYAATYNNIMDYNSILSANPGPAPQQLNNQFVRNTFVKKQWDKMNEKIIKKSLGLKTSSGYIVFGTEHIVDNTLIHSLKELL